MKSEKLVSVIMPVFNGALYIKPSIYSVLTQTYKNFELIIIDDGSEDGTLSIVEEIMDTRISVICTEHSGKPAHPRNIGLEAARGEFAAFIDSDDIWQKTKLEKQLAVFEKDPSVKLVYTLYKIFDTNKIYETILPRSGRRYKGDGMFKKLLYSSIIPNSSVMVRKKVLLEVGKFDENVELKAVEDWDLWLRISRKYRIDFVPEALTFYRDHGSGVSKVSILTRLKRNNTVLKKHFREISVATYIIVYFKILFFLVKKYLLK